MQVLIVRTTAVSFLYFFIPRVSIQGLSSVDVMSSVSDSDKISDVVKDLYRHTWNEKVQVRDCCSTDYEHLHQVEVALEQLKCNLSAHSRTSKLWLQYIDYVDLVKLFIIAERTCDQLSPITCCSNNCTRASWTIK